MSSVSYRSVTWHSPLRRILKQLSAFFHFLLAELFVEASSNVFVVVAFAAFFRPSILHLLKAVLLCVFDFLLFAMLTS